jgi:hypothetical protein
MDHVSAQQDSLSSTIFASKQADVEPTVTTMDWDSVFATQDSTKPQTDHAWLEPLVLLPAPGTLKEFAFAMQVLLCTVITALSAHLELFSTIPPNSVFLSVEKTQLMMQLLRDADVFQDTPFTTKSVTSAQPTTSFKITTVLHAQLTLFTVPLPKSVIVQKDSF